MSLGWRSLGLTRVLLSSKSNSEVDSDKISSCNGSFDQVFNNIKLFIESLYYLLFFGDGGSRSIETWFYGPIFMPLLLWLCQVN